jgi:hypothetical protein
VTLALFIQSFQEEDLAAEEEGVEEDAGVEGLGAAGLGVAAFGAAALKENFPALELLNSLENGSIFTSFYSLNSGKSFSAIK